MCGYLGLDGDTVTKIHLSIACTSMTSHALIMIRRRPLFRTLKCLPSVDLGEGGLEGGSMCCYSSETHCPEKAQNLPLQAFTLTPMVCI